MDSGGRYTIIVLLYRTDKYEGELKASEEERVFGLDRRDISDANLIWNMRELLEIFETDEYGEFFFKVAEGIHLGR